MTKKRFINDVSEILDTYFGYMGTEEPSEREIKEKDYLLIGVARSQRDAESICEKLNEQNEELLEYCNFSLHDLLDEKNKEIEQLKQYIDNIGGRLQGLWANYNTNRYGIWSEAVEDIAKELGFKIYKTYDVPISNSNAKKERINGVKKVNEIIRENEQLKQVLKIYRKVACCGNCNYHNYDRYDDGDEFEVCEKGNDMSDYICEEWSEL